jgi:membrane-associated phospholipid phosphatase
MLDRRRFVTWNVILLVSLAFVIQQVVMKSWLSSFDQDAARLSRELRASREIFTKTVIFGLRGTIISIFIPVFAFIGWKKKTWIPLGGFLLVLLFETGMAGALKLAIGRTFPYDHYFYENVDVNVGEMAFPSGHAANVVALLGYVAWYFSRGWNNTRRMVSWTLVALAAIDVGVSSWLIQTHWPTDLVAGYLIGAIALLAVVALLNASGVSPSATAQRSPATRL